MKTPDSIEKLNEYEMATLLQQVVGFAMSEEQADPITMIVTFEERGLMTKNHGLILKLSNGQEFQLTIVRSK